MRQFWARDPQSATRARAAELLYPWMARSPGQAPAFARSFFGRNLDPADPALSHRPRWDSTTAIKAHAHRGPAGRDRSGRGRASWSRPCRARRAGWDPLSRGAVAGDDHAAARVHPRLPGRPDADGELGGGPVPVPGPRRRRLRQRRARPAQALRAGGEVPAQAGLRRPGAGRHPPPAEAAVPGPGRRELLRRRYPGLVRRGHRTGRGPRGRGVRAGDGRRAAGEVRPDRRGTDEQHRQHARRWRSSPPSWRTSSFIADDGWGAPERDLPEPAVAIDLVTDDRGAA